MAARLSGGCRKSLRQRDSQCRCLPFQMMQRCTKAKAEPPASSCGRNLHQVWVLLTARRRSSVKKCKKRCPNTDSVEGNAHKMSIVWTARSTGGKYTMLSLPSTDQRCKFRHGCSGWALGCGERCFTFCSLGRQKNQREKQKKPARVSTAACGRILPSAGEQKRTNLFRNVAMD